MYQERLPPHDIDAEEAIIGSLLIDSDSTYKVAATLKAEDFYHGKARACYEAAIKLYDQKVPINQVTLAQELARVCQLETIGGAAYLSHLLREVPTSVHLEYYAGIVKNLAVNRKLISVAGQIAGLGYEAGEDSATKALDLLMPIAQEGQKGLGLRSFKEIGEAHWPKFEVWYNSKSELFGIPTGYTLLDKMLGGLEPAKLYIIMARPSMGKSALLGNVAVKLALNNYWVAVFTLEMSADSWFQRCVLARARINRFHLKNMTPDEYENYEATHRELREYPIFVDEMSELSISDLRSRLHKALHEHKVDVVMLDYLGLMSAKGDSGYERTTLISKGLTAIKKEFGLPLVVAAQLNRANTARADKRPQLSDLRDSGQVEQDTDVAISLHREELYTTKAVWDKQHLDEPYPHNVQEVEILKNRDGPLAHMEFYFEATTGLIENMADLKGE